MLNAVLKTALMEGIRKWFPLANIEFHIKTGTGVTLVVDQFEIDLASIKQGQVTIKLDATKAPILATRIPNSPRS